MRRDRTRKERALVEPDEALTGAVSVRDLNRSRNGGERVVQADVLGMCVVCQVGLIVGRGDLSVERERGWR